MNNDEMKYKYIYNIEQALHFVRSGANITRDDVRINLKSGNIFFRFINDDKFKELFRQWCENKPK